MALRSSLMQVEHKVRRMTQAKVAILTCTCGKRILGQDPIDCHRRFDLHVIEHAHDYHESE